ncbi:MAG: DUF4956 domain-containing protein [Planctomycetales bacterium]|nr:DUF4956 domain-containing protein [Planctomycetales bacterium]
MNEQLESFKTELAQAFTLDASVEPMLFAFYLAIGGLMSLYVRFLYRKCANSANDANSVTRVFPLLTLVTIGVITVVKTSMALSLGLVGALSIVRFRAAIKEPEELVYLFLCIGLGLALGAGQPLLAVVLLGLASLFIMGMSFSQHPEQQNLLLTISGDAERYFGDSEQSALNILGEEIRKFSVQRFDVESDRGQLRIVINQSHVSETARTVSKLRQRLPDCDISYVNMQSNW